MIGASIGGKGMTALLPYSALFPPLLIAAGAILLVSTVTGAIVGTVYDGKTADTNMSSEEAEATFEAMAADVRVQDDLLDQVQSAGRGVLSHELVSLKGYGPSDPDEEIGYRVLAESGIQTLLLVHVDTVTLTVEESHDPELALDLSVSSRLLRTADGTQLDQRVFRCRAGRGKVSEWSTEEDESFLVGLSRCHKKVANRLVEEIFLVYEPPQDVGWEFGGHHFATVAEGTLRPTLEWGEFPEPTRREPGAPGTMGGIADVTYDLRMWRAEDDFPGELAYAREALPTPFHHIEEPLDPSTMYFWTVRARFELDGQVRVTPWAVTQKRRGYSPGKLDRVSNDFYYRLTTPSDAAAPHLADTDSLPAPTVLRFGP